MPAVGVMCWSSYASYGLSVSFSDFPQQSKQSSQRIQLFHYFRLVVITEGDDFECLTLLARKIVGIQLSRKLRRLHVTTHQEFQERIKLRERIPHIGPIPIVIPLKIFLDLLLDPLSPRGLSDSQSYVLNFTNVDSWAKSHAMLRDVRESNCKLQP